MECVGVTSGSNPASTYRRGFPPGEEGCLIALRNTNSSALSDRLVRARQKYINERNKVLDLVQQRRGAIGESISDLKAEDQALAQVQAEAQQ